MDISYTAHTHYDDKSGTIVTTITGDNTGDTISFPTEVGVHVAATVLGEFDKHPQARPSASEVAAARRDFITPEVQEMLDKNNVFTVEEVEEMLESLSTRNAEVKVDGPEEDTGHTIPRNHIHIPNLRHKNGTGKNIMIDGHPVAVLEDGLELNGIGDRNNLTTVTLTIVPDKITVDGDMRDPSA